MERLFRGKREQYEGEKTLRGRVIGSFLRRKLEDRVTRLRKEEKFVELSQSPLTADTKIVLAIRSFNYKWETILAGVLFVGKRQAGVYTKLAYGQNIPSEF